MEMNFAPLVELLSNVQTCIEEQLEDPMKGVTVVEATGLKSNGSSRRLFK